MGVNDLFPDVSDPRLSDVYDSMNAIAVQSAKWMLEQHDVSLQDLATMFAANWMHGLLVGLTVGGDDSGKARDVVTLVRSATLAVPSDEDLRPFVDVLLAPPATYDA